MALHPSHFADLTRISVPGPIVISADPPEANAPSQVTTDQADPYAEAIRLEKNRAITMAMCTDLQGHLWCATEGFGVQMWDPKKPPLESWTEYREKDTGDDWTYAIACDTVGRIWVGTLDHGVSVYNGKTWQMYEVLAGLSRPDSRNGPLGSRVFKIVVNPKDGDVWIATEWGLSRYSQSKDTWSYFTRAEGLPSDQANSMAFDAAGNIYVATQCEGIAIAMAADNYATWRNVRGPDTEPLTPNGTGLPSNLMNDIIVASDETVYATTDSGLAWSKDSGKSWQFVRGRNYADKVRLAVGGPPEGWEELPGAYLAEDYCTCLMDAGKEGVWIGHRQTPPELVDTKASSPTAFGSGAYSYCSATAASHAIFGTCADGLVDDVANGRFVATASQYGGCFRYSSNAERGRIANR